MKSHFNFKSLLKRLPNVAIPKEFIYFGIGAVLVVLIGLIVGNMYLQEMLFFEGQEKSIQLFTEEELREYGEIYKEMSLDFENDIGYLIEDYANRTNRAGERIHYGIYNHEHPTDDTNKIKIHQNGENTNKSENSQLSDLNDAMNTFRVKDSYIDTDEFKNGVTIKYAKTNGRVDGESNFKDILTVVSMLIDQKQSKNESTVDVKSKVPDLIRRLFRISHTYTGESTEVYSCEKGCRVLFYYCNEVDNGYVGTGIDLQPFPINPHSDFNDYGDEDFELVEPENECVLCEHNGKGCVLDSKKCYHGNTDTYGEGILGDMGTDYGDCFNYVAVPRCTYTGDGDHDCHAGEEIKGEVDSMGNQKVRLGCGGYYKCLGHEHWNCSGHFYICCMGHTNVTVNIKVMYIDELLDVIKNGYNVGVEDETD